LAKHIGIVGCSAEGAALCYRTICAEAPREMGEHRHPEITMHTHPLSDYMVYIRAGDWEKVAELMLSSTHKLARVGVDLAICPDNTIHQSFQLVKQESPIPWLHIAEAVAETAKQNGFERLAILGTKYLMTGPVYPEVLEKFGITCEIPDEKENILKMGKWNALRIRVVGDKVTTWLNGVKMVELEDEKIGEATGSIALQIHSGGGIKIRWKNALVKEIL